MCIIKFRVVMFLVVLCCCRCSTNPVYAQSALRYSVKDIGLVSDGDFIQSFAINSPGEIVGASNFHAFLWTASRIATLKSLPNAFGSAAYSINSKGNIVGHANQTAFFWNRKTLAFLPPLEQSAMRSADSSQSAASIREQPSSYAYSINDKDWIAGSAQTSSRDRHAVLWRQGRILDLGLFGGSSEARAVNNRGQVVVWTFRNPDPLREADHLAFLWENGGSKQLGKFIPYAINNKGEVVGQSGREAVMYSHDKLTLLPALSGKKDIEATAALAINDSGQAVGVTGRYPLSFEGDNTSPALNRLTGYAVLWQEGQVFDLNSLIPSDTGWQLEQATGINNKGYIIGMGLFKGNNHAFVLTPLQR